MTWAKIDTGFHRNPKIRMAGRDARDVYLFIVLANADQCADGSLPGLYANPTFLADALQCDEASVRNGLKRCETFQLLHVTEGEIRIIGWDEDWRTKNSTDRVRKHRETKKAKKKQGVTDDETLRNVSRVSRNGCNALDREIERVDREEKREKIDISHPAGERVIPKPRFDIESVYQLYPKKQGKQKGLTAARKKIKTDADFLALTVAVETMAKAWAGKDTKFCPQWVTFINQERWRDDELPLPEAEAVGAQRDIRIGHVRVDADKVYDEPGVVDL